MPPTTPSAEAARELLRKTAALTTRLAELGARGTAAAAALARPGAPPSDALVQALGDAGREFEALRSQVFAAASALGLPTPPAETIDSTQRLEAMLKVLLDGLERAEEVAEVSKTVTVLDRIAALGHREERGFAALASCQSRAADVRGALASTGKIDAAAAAPFEALLRLVDGQQDLDDDEWGALEEQVAAAFGRTLAVAARRGKLVAR